MSGFGVNRPSGCDGSGRERIDIATMEKIAQLAAWQRDKWRTPERACDLDAAAGAAGLLAEMVRIDELGEFVPPASAGGTDLPGRAEGYLLVGASAYYAVELAAGLDGGEVVKPWTLMAAFAEELRTRWWKPGCIDAVMGRAEAERAAVAATGDEARRVGRVAAAMAVDDVTTKRRGASRNIRWMMAAHGATFAGVFMMGATAMFGCEVSESLVDPERLSSDEVRWTLGG